MIALMAAAGAGIALLLCLVRLFAGPTLYDRVLAANGVAMKLVLVVAAAAVLAAKAAWIDLAIAFALGALVVNVAVLKFFQAGTFQPPLARVEDR